MSNPNEIINDWKPETRSLIRALRKAYFVIVEANNGEEGITEDLTEANVVDNLTACDEASLHVKCPDGKTRWISLIYGNSPGELCSDWLLGCYSLDSVLDSHAARWEGRKQPTTTTGKAYPQLFK